MSKLKRNVWIISFIVTAGGFFLLYKFTIHPSTVSGNGNPALIILWLFWPAFICFYYLTGQTTRVIFTKYRNINLIFSVLLICTGASLLLLIPITSFAGQLIETLGGPSTEPDSRIYRFPLWNQYTNSLFFNIYTFLLSIFVTAIIATSTLLIKRGN
ncbi:hypothetical protein SAMN05877753_10649 [Bacillus oleivorans]|uniref:Uncharacterized protein n=1 Tax=Bacillus oleivorans TaxID=1448271 RepID=A0A285CXX8_9BACI|nr:hypothetical protein [Bacillus oleivorans]SNX72390.1 hypothetical protein SAMN05877753_10649 [Bacillus oleivorans]